jgi:small subunit ribosomal protein S9
MLSRATGRRKEAVCRARLLEGSGRYEINGRPLEDYFPSATHRMIIAEPLKLTNTDGRYDILAKIEGGGVAGQAGALRHAISKALVDLDPELRPILKKSGFLTRDAREKERRKYGLKKARKAPQYSKR